MRIKGKKRLVGGKRRGRNRYKDGRSEKQNDQKKQQTNFDFLIIPIRL